MGENSAQLAQAVASLKEYIRLELKGLREDQNTQFQKLDERLLNLESPAGALQGSSSPPLPGRRVLPRLPGQYGSFNERTPKDVKRDSGEQSCPSLQGDVDGGLAFDILHDTTDSDNWHENPMYMRSSQKVYSQNESNAALSEDSKVNRRLLVQTGSGRELDYKRSTDTETKELQGGGVEGRSPLSTGAKDNSNGDEACEIPIHSDVQEEQACSSGEVQGLLDNGKAKAKRSVSALSEREPANSVTSEANAETLTWKEWIKFILYGVLHPDERGNWDLYILLLMCWVCIVSPYTICFGISADITSVVGLLELLVDLSFAFDIYLNFRTGFYDDEGTLVTKRLSVAKNYAKGWLWVDLVSVVNLDRIFKSFSNIGSSPVLQASRIVKAIKILRLLKAVRMLRLLRLPQLFELLEKILGKPFFRLFRFMFAVVIISHWSACLFHYVAFLESDNVFTWLDEISMDSASNLERYMTALYWAFATMTSVGYGDVVAMTVKEKCVAIVCMIVGVTVFAYLMGAVTSLLGALNSSQARIAAKKQMVDEFLKARKVPTVLSNRIRHFYNYIVDKEVRNDETDIIAGLPNKLRTEIILYLFRETLHKVLYFENKAPQFLAELVMMMKIEFYAPGDFVVVQGEMSTEMYFVGEGTLAIRDYGNIDNLPKLLYSGENLDVACKHLGHITAGNQFGEYACLTMEPRTATVVAETFCELYSLSRDALQEVMGRWPEYGNEMTHHMMKQSRAANDKRTKKKAGNDDPPKNNAPLQPPYPSPSPATPRGSPSGSLVTKNASSSGLDRTSTFRIGARTYNASNIPSISETRAPRNRSNSNQERNLYNAGRFSVTMRLRRDPNQRPLQSVEDFYHPAFTSQSDEAFIPKE